VFIFRAAGHDVLLLDRYHQAISFPDMIVATQSEANRVSIDYNCQAEAIHFDGRDATRATFAAILQNRWAIAPTHELWTEEHNSIEDNYLWSVSNTPFGPFNSHLDISFAIKDAASRNRIYKLIARMITDLNRIIAHYAHFYGRDQEIFLQTLLRYSSFGQRYNLFKWKMEEANKELSYRNFNNTLSFLISAEKDVHELHQLMHNTGDLFKTQLRCEADDIKELSLEKLAGILSACICFGICGFFINRGIKRTLKSKSNKQHTS